MFADAGDAIDAAIAAQRGLQAEPWGDTGSLRVRMGVHTGSAEQRDGDYYGPAVNQAARLMGIAHGGQIVCSGVVAELVGGHVELADLGAHRLRDVESAVRVFQIVAPGLESQFPPLALAGCLSLEPAPRDGRIRGPHGRRHRGREGARRGPGGVDRRDGRRGQDPPGVAGRLRSCCPSSRMACGGASWPACAIPTPSPKRSPPRSGYAPSQGVSLADGLAGFFRHKQLLLVLDNCEHLLGAVAGFVRAMSEEAPQLSVLATSREALGIQGERVYPLPPLELPVDTSPFEVEESEAGALFATRAREARADVQVMPTTPPRSPTCARASTPTRWRSNSPPRARP